MKLRFWNTSTGTLLNEVDTGSQVRPSCHDWRISAHVRAFASQICNLLWSKNSNELVSTHGFSAGSAQNQGDQRRRREFSPLLPD